MMTISSGHFGKCSGAVSLIDEAVEARKVAQAVVHVWPFSSGALTHRVLDLWSDEQTIIRQLERGVADGVFQDIWLQQAKAGTLSLYDYLALSTLQLKK